MKRKYKKPLTILIYSTALLFILYFLLGVWIESKIEDKLDGLKNNGIEISYESMYIEPALGNISLKNVKFNKNKHLSGVIEECGIRGFSFWKLWKNKIISIDKVTIENSNVHLNVIKKKTNTSQKKKLKSFELNISELELLNSSIELVSDSTVNQSTTNFKVLKLKFIQLTTNAKVISDKIPFKYDVYDGEIKDFTTNLDVYHKLNVSSINFDEKRWTADKILIKPLLSKQAFSDTLKYERDYMKLNGESVTIYSPRIKEIAGEVIFTGKLVLFDNFDFDIYRDKRLPDDVSIKPMYSELLRNMTTVVTIDSIGVNSSRIKYAEHLENAAQPGEISFYEFNVGVSKINTAKSSVHNNIVVKIESKFMNQAPVTIDWTFDIKNMDDSFDIKGNIKKVNASSINAFIKPALNIEAEGSLDALYFNFSGDKYTAYGSTAMEYDTFDVKILKKDGKRKKSVLTLLSNLIIDRKEDKGIVNQRDIEVIRDKTKSFWNYFWLCIKNGLIKTMI